MNLIKSINSSFPPSCDSHTTFDLKLPPHSCYESCFHYTPTPLTLHAKLSFTLTLSQTREKSANNSPTSLSFSRDNNNNTKLQTPQFLINIGSCPHLTITSSATENHTCWPIVRIKTEASQFQSFTWSIATKLITPLSYHPIKLHANEPWDKFTSVLPIPQLL